MSEAMQPVSLVALSPEAFRTVCGLVQPSTVVDSEEVCAADEIWAEIRSAFPAAEAAQGEDEPGPPTTPASVETCRILVLDDGETFSGLGGSRIYEIPAEWEIEEIEEALSERLAEAHSS